MVEPVILLSMGLTDLLKIIHIWSEYLIPYNCRLFVFIIITWSYNCLLIIIIISYLKPYNYMQTKDYHLTEIVTRNHN